MRWKSRSFGITKSFGWLLVTIIIGTQPVKLSMMTSPSGRCSAVEVAAQCQGLRVRVRVREIRRQSDVPGR